MSKTFLTTFSKQSQQCFQQIRQENKKKIINKIAKSKKQIVSHKPCDPVISQVYIGWQQELIKTRRVKTQQNLSNKAGKIKWNSVNFTNGISNSNTKTNANVQSGKQKQLQFKNKKDKSQSFLFSHSVQFPMLSKDTGKNSHSKNYSELSNLSQLRIKKVANTHQKNQNQVLQLPHDEDDLKINKSHKALLRNKSKSIHGQKQQKQTENQPQKFKKRLANIVQKAYKNQEKRRQQKSVDRSLQRSIQRSLQRQRQNSRQQIIKKNNALRNLKLQKLRKNNSVIPRKSLPWHQIDILKMQTYFIKLFKSKFQFNKQIIVQQLKDSHIIQKMHIPKRQNIPDYIREYKSLNPELDINQLMKKINSQIVIDQQAVYFGEIQNQKRVGYGVYICKNYRFQGNWANDSKNYGYQITPQGYYKGKFKNNRRHGQGQFAWKNGQKYEGQWVKGMKHGSGVWKTDKGDSYIGQWSNGKVQGYGVHITTSGQRYEGYFKNFLKNGHGKQFFPNGDIYEGQYKNGKPFGKGKYIWKNKVVYEGQFVQGFRHGRGTIKAQNYMKYTGQFIAEKPHGKGQLNYQNGDNFVGQFKLGEKNGHGIMRYKNLHKIITGTWNKNKLQQQFSQQKF